LPALFAVIGSIVAVAMLLAWRVRFRSRPYEAAAPSVAVPAPGSDGGGSPGDAPLPPSAFLSAVERALGQRVVSLRLRTPSNVFRLEPPQQED
jgi:hypothetical protein